MGGLREARRGIGAAAAEPPAGVPFVDAVMAAVGRVVGYDGYCLFGVDPVTGLRTSMFSRNGLMVGSDRLVHNETVERDANRYVALIAGPRPAGVLAVRRVGEPRSPRLHEILRPQGYSSELRVVLVDGDVYVGALNLFRDDLRRPFVDADTDRLVELIPLLCKAIRRYHVRSQRPLGAAAPAGVVVVGADRRLSASAAAGYWLSELTSGGPAGVTEDDAARSVYEVARAVSLGAVDPLCRVRTRNGHWLVVSGSRMGDSAVAVVLQPASVAQVLPAFGAWCGFTARERQVVGLALAGRAAKQIARRLNLSVLTVNDHLRSSYRKAGVRGRDELAARVS